MAGSKKDVRQGVWLALFFFLVAGGAIAAYAMLVEQRGPGLERAVVEELQDRGRVVVVGNPRWEGLTINGAELLSPDSLPSVADALARFDEVALEEAMRDEHVAALLVASATRPLPTDGGEEADVADAPSLSLRERLTHAAPMHVLRAAVVTPMSTLYLRPHRPRITPSQGGLLSRVARQLLAGASTPPIRAFPRPLRVTQNVEVMVLIEEDGRARLWRSARGSSIVRALITAASVAKERWAERQRAMNGPLLEQLPRLTVRVVLLEEDGTLLERNPNFIERVVHEDHGVAFEADRAWHYLLPDATRERGEGSAMRAYQALLDDAGMPAESLARPDLRLYRLRATVVGSSLPEPVAPANSIDELGVL